MLRNWGFAVWLLVFIYIYINVKGGRQVDRKASRVYYVSVCGEFCGVVSSLGGELRGWGIQ